MNYQLLSRIPAFAVATALFLAVMAAMWVFLPNVAGANTITVDTTADDNTVNNNCTLREAIIAANTDTAVDACPAGSGADTIELPSGTYVLSLAGTNEDAAATGDLDITDDLAINGAGRSTTIIDGGELDRVMEIRSSASATLNGVTIQNGKAIGDGGGILNRSILGISNSNIRTNTASIRGGGIFNRDGGSLDITNTVFTLNHSDGRGGGIDNRSLLTVTVTSSTFAANTSLDDGGGIYNSGPMTISHTSVDGNTATNSGGGIRNDGTLIVDNTTITGNFTDNDGGGILNRGMLTIRNSSLSNNTASGTGRGGGVRNNGTLQVDNSTITGNVAHDDGGGIHTSDFTSTEITNSTLSNNTAFDRGGGVRNEGITNITNTTISGNSARHNGGGVEAAEGTINLNNVTITNNTADSDGNGFGSGGGIRIQSNNTMNAKNTLIARNSRKGGALLADCSGTLISQGHNLIGSEFGCVITGDTTGNVTGLDPLLGPLADNGGPTEAHLLSSVSPAVDAAACTDLNGVPVADDQRGVARPQGSNCDIGAFERTPTDPDLPAPGNIQVSVFVGSIDPAKILSGSRVDVCEARFCIAQLTDANGKYQAPFAPGTYDVQVFPLLGTCFPPQAVAPFTLISGESRTFDVVMSTIPCPTVQGHVYADSIDPANAVPGAPVGVLDGVGPQATITDARGFYTATVLPGDVNLRVLPPVGFDLISDGVRVSNILPGETRVQDIVLSTLVPVPEEVEIMPVRRTIPPFDTPVVGWKNPITVTKDVTDHCGPDSPVQINLVVKFEETKNTVNQMMTNTIGEDWSATFLPFHPEHGPALLTFYVDCPPDTLDFPENITLIGPDDETQIGGHIYIDPSGVVLDTDNNPIVGATVTLFRSDDSGGTFTQVPDGSAVMSPSNRSNPDSTDSEGAFGWDVIAGFYVVRAEAPGCVSPGDPTRGFVETGVLSIPPPVTDLVLVLECRITAEPSFTLYQDTTDAATGLKLDITRVYDPSTGNEMAIPFDDFTAQLTYDGGCFNVLGVRDLDFSIDINDLQINNGAGETTMRGASALLQDAPSDLSHVLSRLVGNNQAACAVDLEITALTGDDGINIPVVPPSLTQNLLRGDARADGNVTIADALFIAQYLAGSRSACTTEVNNTCLHSVNAASVGHDGEFDKKTIADALFIAQHLVGLRDQFFNLVSSCAINQSNETLCAEEDNVNIPLMGNVSSFVVEATHPAYELGIDNCQPDFSNCNLSPGTDYPFTPGVFELFNDGETIVEAVREASWWQPSGMLASVDDREPITVTDAHFIRIYRKISGANEWPQFFVFYADGNLRLIPHPPEGTSSVCFGSSVIIGPAQVAPRPFAQVDSVRYISASKQLEVVYKEGGTATLSLGEVDREAARVRVTVNYPTGTLPFATFRSMFVADGNSDVDHVESKDASGDIHDHAIMAFPGGQGTDWLFYRRTKSQHNTSAPDIRITIE